MEKNHRILSYFPRKHFYLLVLISFIFLILFFLSPSQEKQQKELGQSLITEVSLESLKQTDLTIDIGNSLIIKESVIRRNDSLFSILKNMGAKTENIIDLINSPNSHLLTNIKIGNLVKVELIEEKITNLIYIEDYKTEVIAKHTDKGYLISRNISEEEKTEVFKAVTIANSLYTDGLKQDIPDSVLMDLVYIFGWDIDFVHDIRPGDQYSLIYEEVYVNGEKKLNGDIIIAEFINQDKSYTAVRYKLKKGNSEYFSTDGRNVKKAFLRTPVKLSYVSSKYNLKRKHPILHTIRAHKGVDYAANRGSPIRATGSGTISSAKVNGGCGKEIKIKHSADYTTRYCHLERFAKNIKEGKKVIQGQTIGYVGSTGLATGPHLHYEFHVNGKHKDPLKVKFPYADPIGKDEETKFFSKANYFFDKLKKYQSLSG